MEMGNFDAAIDTFQTTRERCNECMAAVLGHGIAASRNKDFTLAKQSFEKALKVDPKNVKAKYYLAVVENFGFKKKQVAVKLLADLLDSDDKRNLSVKRKANFLMRRIEAQLYAQKTERNIPLEEQISPEEEQLVLDEKEKTE